MGVNSEAELETLRSEAISYCKEGNFDKAIEIHSGSWSLVAVLGSKLASFTREMTDGLAKVYLAEMQ